VLFKVLFKREKIKEELCFSKNRKNAELGEESSFSVVVYTLT
jgi:hypothetical protein